MGLLEYLTMHDVAHDGWLCTFTICKTAPGNSISLQLGNQATGTVRKRKAVRPVQHVQNHTCWVNLFQPARRVAVQASPQPSASLATTMPNILLKTVPVYPYVSYVIRDPRSCLGRGFELTSSRGGVRRSDQMAS